MIVIDAAALVHALTDTGPRGSAIRARLKEEDGLAAPYLLDTEILSNLVRLSRGSRGKSPVLGKDLFTKATAEYSKLPIVRHDIMLLWPRMTTLGAILSVYDASYVALGEALDCDLLTSDAKIKSSYENAKPPGNGRKIGITVH